MINCLIFLCLTAASTHIDEDFYTIRACSRTFPVNTSIPNKDKELSHCFFMFSQSGRRLDTRGFYDDDGGSVLEEDEKTLANSRIITDPILSIQDKKEASKAWGDLEKCYEREKGKYSLLTNNCCTVASRCLDLLVEKYGDSIISKDSHIRDVNPSTSYWDRMKDRIGPILTDESFPDR